MYKINYAKPTFYTENAYVEIAVQLAHVGPEYPTYIIKIV